MALSCAREVQIGYQEAFLLQKRSEVLEWAAQGSDGVSDGVAIPGGLQEKGGCRTELHGQSSIRHGLMVGRDDLFGLSSLHGSTILYTFFS